MRIRKRRRLLVSVLLIICITACGSRADTDFEAGQAGAADDVTGSVSTIGHAGGDVSDTGSGNDASGELPDTGAEDQAEEETSVLEGGAAAAEPDESDAVQMEAGDVIWVCATEDIEYSDEVIPVQYVDDLSLLEELKDTNKTYVYQDGSVYYRRYHEDSYEESALWGDYAPVPGTQKEIIRVDADGTETVLFTDEGEGAIYLINDRFYLKGWVTDADTVTERGCLYSVDMQGNDRIDYGNGAVFAVDRARNILIIWMWGGESGAMSYSAHPYGYYVLNTATGEITPIDFGDDDYVVLLAYRDGWFYYEMQLRDEESVRRLCAISLEGEKREIMALTSWQNQQERRYKEGILQLEVDGDRIYFIWGDYDGSATVFQGGILVSVKLDGTDYKGVEVEWDTFYLSHDNGKTLIYFPRQYHPFSLNDDIEYNMYAWDIEADKCYFSDFPRKIFDAYCTQNNRTWWYDPRVRGALCPWGIYGEDPWTVVDAIPDDSGRIVRLVADLESCFTKWQGGEYDEVEYRDWYYADGFLYFEAEYRVYDMESSIGWRDGFRRMHTEVYRLKIGEDKAQMLYSY